MTTHKPQETISGTQGGGVVPEVGAGAGGRTAPAYADPVANAEVARLRAENESLWADLDKYDLQAWEDMEERVKKAEAENERLQHGWDYALTVAEELKAENERLRAKVARVEALHQPRTDDGPFSLIDLTFCSCGARAVRTMPDGHSSIAPVPYDECPTRTALADPQEAK